MKRNDGLTILLFWGVIFSAGAVEEILFQSDFGNNKTLRGWIDYKQKDPPGSHFCAVVFENGVNCLKMQKVETGISHPLKYSLRINDSIKNVTMHIELKSLSGLGHIALGTGESPDPNTGGAFQKRKDSGIYVNGFYKNEHRRNSIAYRLNGKEIIMGHPGESQCRFLNALNDWVVWTLIYDNQKKQLRFYNTEKLATPKVTLYNVNLTGVELRSIWLSAQENCYKNIRVTCEKL